MRPCDTNVASKHPDDAIPFGRRTEGLEGAQVEPGTFIHSGKKYRHARARPLHVFRIAIGFLEKISKLRQVGYSQVLATRLVQITRIPYIYGSATGTERPMTTCYSSSKRFSFLAFQSSNLFYILRGCRK